MKNDNGNNQERKVRTVFPKLHTFEVVVPGKENKNEATGKSVTGFVVDPMDRKDHEQEFPGLYRYNLELSDADGALRWKCLNDRIKDRSTLLYTAEPVEMMSTEYYEGAEKGYVKGQTVPVTECRKPTRDEVKAFCSHPKMAPLLKDFPMNYLPFDVNGERIRPAASWNALVDWAETDKLMKENVELLKRTITAPVTNKDGKTFQVDFNLAAPLQRIIDAGFHTGQSDSGTVADHPNQRYVEDSDSGLFRKGDPLPPGCTAYLTFWLPEAQGVPTNTERQVKHIEQQALASGWCVERMPIFGQPSLRLTLPETMDGTSSLAINREASALMQEKYPEMTIDSDLKGYFKTKYIEKQAIIARHGGPVNWTDGEVLEHWNTLAARLEWCMQLDNTTGWLTAEDVHSVLLDPQTSQRFFTEHENNRIKIVESLKPQWHLHQEMQIQLYDEVSRKHGFDGFNENEEGTAVRNYTALKKPADRHTRQRLDAFDAEITERLRPLFRFAERISKRSEQLLRNEDQRYLQSIHALTAPMIRKRDYDTRLSDATIYRDRNSYSPKYYVRCKIDGEQQFGKQLSREDQLSYTAAPGLMDKKELAARYFRNELDRDRSQEQDRGLHR